MPGAKKKGSGKKPAGRKEATDGEHEPELLDEEITSKRRENHAAIVLQSAARRKQAAQRVEGARSIALLERQHDQRTWHMIMAELDERWLSERRAVCKPGYPGSLAPRHAVTAELERFAAIKRSAWRDLHSSGTLKQTDGDTSAGSSDSGAEQAVEQALW